MVSIVVVADAHLPKLNDLERFSIQKMILVNYTNFGILGRGKLFKTSLACPFDQFDE